MGDKKEKLERKLAKANEGLALAEKEYEKFSNVQKNLDYFKARVEKITKLLSEV